MAGPPEAEGDAPPLVLPPVALPPGAELDEVEKASASSVFDAHQLDRAQHLLGLDNYRAFALLSEWKPAGAPDVRAERATQELLVRRERGFRALLLPRSDSDDSMS